MFEKYRMKQTEKKERIKQQEDLRRKLCDFDSELIIFPGNKEEYEELYREEIEIIDLDPNYKYIQRGICFEYESGKSIKDRVRYEFCAARNPFVVLNNADSFMLNEPVRALIQYIPFSTYYFRPQYDEVGVGIPVRIKGPK
ncbi:MAG: hypothetical protein ACP5N3_00440 [Candidatus Nanoarchaeia archaeon]